MRMGYVIAVLLVLLIVGAGITFMVLRAPRTQRSRAAADSEYGNDAAIVAPDSNTPLGDTDQHAGEQTREGTTVGSHDIERGGDGGSASEGPTTAPPDSDEPSAPQPDSERLADRPR
jgi:hypothetical protein